MQELFTKKNILITTSVLIGIIAIFPVSGYVSTEWRKYYSNQLLDKNKELAPTREKLSQNLLQSLKDRNKDNLRAMYCDVVAHRLHETSQRMFNKFWQEVEKEDYSEATTKFEPSPNDSKNEDLVMTNVKTGELVKDRSFLVDNKGNYYCVTPIDRSKPLD